MSETVGMVYPPSELKVIVDRTAEFVAKNGGAFEERLKREHRDKPKFSFLFQGDPYNPYYLHRVKESQAPQSTDTTSKSQSARLQHQDSQAFVARPQADDHDDSHEARSHVASSDQSRFEHNHEDDTHGNHLQSDSNESISNKQNSHDTNQNDQTFNQEPDTSSSGHDGGPRVRLKLNEYIQEMTMKLEEPPSLNFLAAPAPSLTLMDCDIMKLTSQFIATHGRSFLLELVSREQNNSQFDFLKPQHGQFSYMTNLIMQYALIQNQPLDIFEQLTKDSTNHKHVLDKIKMRAEWNRMLELEKKKREEAEEKEKVLYSQIDWHDFVIVETIDYQPNERGEYPPTTADQVGTRLLLQQRYEEQNVPEEMEIDMDVESDQEEEKEETNRETNDDFLVPDMPSELLPPQPDRVVIRKDYDPKAVAITNTQADNYFVSPITNERIPVDKIYEHVRYNLSDPRYLEKKDQILQERMNEEAVFASGSQIQSSLKSLAERRTDIFGMDDKETAIGRRIGEEEQEGQPKDDRLIWDGHKSSLKKKKLG